ncbi:hypothetical protein EniLVp02_0264 [Vibrio phage EniLVp02]
MDLAIIMQNDKTPILPADVVNGDLGRAHVYHIGEGIFGIQFHTVRYDYAGIIESGCVNDVEKWKAAVLRDFAHAKYKDCNHLIHGNGDVWVVAYRENLDDPFEKFQFVLIQQIGIDSENWIDSPEYSRDDVDPWEAANKLQMMRTFRESNNAYSISFDENGLIALGEREPQEGDTICCLWH